MSVAALDKAQHLVLVPVPTSDNLLFVGYLVVVIGGYIYAKGLEGGSDYGLVLVFLGIIGVGLSFISLEIVAQWKLGKMRAVPLPAVETTVNFRRVLEREVAGFGFSKQDTPQVLWIPANWRLGARVLGGFRRRLVVTGKTCVAVAKEDPAALFVLRHELAHLKNRDTRLYLVVVYGCLIPLAILAGLLQQDGSATRPGQITIILNLVMVFFVSTFLLRRREYLADAVAVNASPSGDEYFDFLAQASPSESGWFHPSPARRLEALRRKSPVLSLSVPFLLLCASTVGAALANIQSSYVAAYVARRPLPEAFQQRNLCFFFTIVPILAMFFEVAKDFRRKIPADSSARPAAAVDKRWVIALCAMNGSSWALTTFFRFLDRESFVNSAPGSSWLWDQGTSACVIISALWFVVAFGLLRYKRWARRAGILLGFASVVCHIYEFQQKTNLSWFSPEEETGGILIIIGSGVAIVLGLIFKKTMPALDGRTELRPPWSQIFFGPIFMVLLIFGMMTTFFALLTSIAHNHQTSLNGDAAFLLRSPLPQDGPDRSPGEFPQPNEDHALGICNLGGRGGSGGSAGVVGVKEGVKGS
jgi:Zn-dependent protease with chaperone function